MFGIKETKICEISAKELIEHLSILQRTEDEIHSFSKWADTANVKAKAVERQKIATELNEAFHLLEADINKATNNKGPENAMHFKVIKHVLQKIENTLYNQLVELEDEKTLLDNFARIQVIDGMNKSGDSRLTSQIKELSNILNSQSGIIARYVVEVEEEVKQVKKTENTDSLQEIYLDNFQRDFDRLKGIDRSKLLSLKDFYELRLSGNEKEYIKNWFTCSQTIAHGENGFKIIQDPSKSDLLMKNNPKVVNYESLDAVEIKYTQGEWGKNLSKEEVLSHVFYNALFPVGTSDRKIFEKYVNWWFDRYKRAGMGVYIDTSIRNEWRLVLRNGGSDDSSVIGINSFYGEARFISRP